MVWATEFLEDVYAEWLKRDQPDEDLECEVMIALEGVKEDPLGRADKREPTDMADVQLCSARVGLNIWLAYCADESRELLGALWLGHQL